MIFSFKKAILPVDFDWKFYLSKYEDLRLAGLSTERDAINHYRKYGHKESRDYKFSKPVQKNEIYSGASILICGTSKEIEILKDLDLVKRIEDKFFVFCINTSYSYFNKISCLFLNGRFTHLTDESFVGKEVDQIFINSRYHNFSSIKTNVYDIKFIQGKYQSEIDININNILPHGPTTLLDIVFPFCCFNNVKNIFILGAEYPKDEIKYERHADDKKIIDRIGGILDRHTEMEMAHKKLNLWNEYFKNNKINCYALSENSETPFQKTTLSNIL